MSKIKPFFKYSLVFIFFTFIGSVLFASKEIQVDLKGNLVSYNFKFKENRTFMPVTITHYSKDLYLTANYTDIFLLNTNNGNVYKFIAQSDKKKKVLNVSKLTFVPTGLFYSKKNKKLYVANYKGNNILIFDVDIQDKTLKYKGEIKTKNTIGPENVYVTDDGKQLATSCYDGSKVTYFKIDGLNYKEIWSTKIGQAHGVCIVDDYVYATGLTERKIYKLNIKNGHIEKSIGNINSNPDKDGFLWPTSIYPLNNKELVASDAHTGYIYVLDIDTLEIKKFFGGNAPTYKYLHMPYSISISDGKYLITSTFQDRIIKGNINNFKANKSFVFKGKDWKKLQNQKVKSFIKEYDTYNYKKGSIINIFDHNYTLGFGHLYSVKNDFPVLRFPDIGTLNNDSAYFYFTDSIEVKKNHILFSPQSQAAVFLINSKKINYIIPFELDSTDYWKVNNNLFNSEKKYNLNNIVKISNEKVKKLEKLRLKNGLLKLKDIYQIIYNNEYRPFLGFTDKYEGFKQKFKTVFTSDEGKVFLEKYLEIQQESNISSNDVENLALEYYKKSIKKSYVDMSEFIMIQTLTGFVNFEKMYKNDNTFLECKNTHYAVNYTPKVLQTPSLNDYTSPNTIHDSCFIIKRNNPITPTKLKLIWYSPQLYGIDFKLYGISKSGQEELLLDIKDNKAMVKNALSYNEYNLTSEHSYNKFKFVATRANKQNRLLLRDFKIEKTLDKINITRKVK